MSECWGVPADAFRGGGAWAGEGPAGGGGYADAPSRGLAQFVQRGAVGPPCETGTVDETNTALPACPLDVPAAEGAAVHHEPERGAGQVPAPGMRGRGWVLVGQGLGHGPERHLDTLPQAVPRADMRTVLDPWRGEHPPAVAAQHPRHGQGQSLGVQLRQFLGGVEAEPPPGQWPVPAHQGRAENDEEGQGAEGTAAPATRYPTASPAATAQRTTTTPASAGSTSRSPGP